MKTNRIVTHIIFLVLCLLISAAPSSSFGQKPAKKQSARQNTKQEQKDDQTPNVLDQNISIYAENESLSNVIERICNYLNLDYSYNSKLIEGKNINLNVSNKPIKYVLDQLMKDFYLLFEIEDNILVIRDYVPMDKSLDYDKKIRNYSDQTGFIFDNPKRKSITINFKSSSNLIIIPVAINNSDTLNFMAWKTHNLIFRATSLSEVIGNLEKVYKVNIRLGDPKLNGLLLTAHFNNYSLDFILKVIETTFKIETQKTNGQYILKAKS